jgi:hypothetical protein
MEPTQNMGLLEKNTKVITTVAVVKRMWMTPGVEVISDVTIQSGNDYHFTEGFQPAPQFPITGSAS